MTRNTTDCAEALRHLAAFLDRELTPLQGERVEAHLEACRSCYSRAEFERRLKESLLRLGGGPLRADFERRIDVLVQGLARD